MRTESVKHPGYSGPASLGTVFALAEPEFEPLPRPARTCLLWDGTEWAEIDPATGEILSTGSASPLRDLNERVPG